MKKIFFGSNRVRTRDLQVMEPACYQKAMVTCCYKDEFFIEFKITACFQQIFALPTSQSGQPEKKQPRIPCGNLISFENGQKWVKILLLNHFLYQIQRFQRGESTHLYPSQEIARFIAIYTINRQRFVTKIFHICSLISDPGKTTVQFSFY